MAARSKPRRTKRRVVRKRRAAPRRRKRTGGVTVTIQVVPRQGGDLLALVKRWVDQEAHTLYFTSRRPRLRLEHRSPRFPGHIELYRRGTLLFGEARAPRGAAPWGVVEKFVGRLIDKLYDQVGSINLQINPPR
jgi:hypothetical protein